MQLPWKHGLSLLLKLVMMLAGRGGGDVDPNDEDVGQGTGACQTSAPYPDRALRCDMCGVIRWVELEAVSCVVRWMEAVRQQTAAIRQQHFNPRAL